MKNWLVSLLMLLIGRRRPKPVPPEPEQEPRAELLAIVLLALGALCAIAFVVVYAVDRLPSQTQLLGASLGLSLLFIAAALLVTSKKLIVTEEIEDDYPVDEHPEEQETIARVVEESGDRLTRRRLFKLSLGAAGGALGVAIITPAASLGPVLDMDPFFGTPWKKGRRLVDEGGKPWRASDIEEADFYTAFPENADKEAIGSPLVVVRLKPSEIKSHKGFAANGIVAYSKICTHAGCAISLYRAPLYQPDEPRPGARLPVPLLDVRPCRRRQGDVRPRGPQAADAAARRRREGLPARGGELQRAGRPVVVGRPPQKAEPAVIKQIVQKLDQRSGTAPLIRKTLRYLFPDHWSFLLGEVAMYAFIVLVATGTYLALFYQDSTAVVTYHGPYQPLQGQEMSEAYRSVLNISTTVKAGLLIRQTHHWAANVFLAAIVLHLFRVFFTGAYRKPRELTYWIGVTMLFTALLEGYLGYSLADDLLSGMGLAIGNGVVAVDPLRRREPRRAHLGRPVPGPARVLRAHVHLPRLPAARADRACCSPCTWCSSR